MDPLKEGDKIFKNVAESFTWTHTDNITEAQNFLNALIKETEGLVIVDFLDAGNWDCLERVDIMEKEGILFLHWRDYRGKVEDPTHRSARQMAFPAELYSAMFLFNELRVEPTKFFPLILLRGYAMKDKEIKKILSPETTEFKIFDNENNFSRRAFAKKDGHFEVTDCFNTPIFSAIIIPKNSAATSLTSKKALLFYNLHDSLSRLNNIRTELENETLKNKDVICEKANSVRRVFEYVLKVECCYRYRQISVKKDYSDLLLGDLIKLIKDFREDFIKEYLTKIAIWANELSHDSGKPIKKEVALLLTLSTIMYTEFLKMEIDLEPFPY